MGNLFDSLKGLIKNRSVRYGSNALVMTAVVVAIAIFANVLIGMTGLKLDLTPNKLYSIGDTTKQILSGVKKDVEIIGLFDEGQDSQYQDVTQLLEKYKAFPHIKVSYIDPDKNPTLLKELDPDGTKNIAKNDFIVRSGNKTKVMSYYDLFETQMDQNTFQTYTTGSKAEQGFTGAVKYVTSDKTPVVYYIQGHDEYDMAKDMQQIKSYIESNNYEVKPLNLMTVDKVPADAEMLLIANPKKDMSSGESAKLMSYMKDGGKAIFMLDSLQSDPSLTEFEKVLAEYNVGFNYDKVKENDSDRHIPNDEYTILLDVPNGSIVPNAFQMVLANSRSVKILKNDKEWITTTSLMSTSDKAAGVQIDPSRGADNAGPLNIAVSSENKGGASVSKVIVMGNASFMTDNAQSQYGPYFQYGANFFLYSLNWMLDKKDDIVIESKAFSSPQMQISAEQSMLTGVAVAIVLPLLILAAALMVFIRRRHL